MPRLFELPDPFALRFEGFACYMAEPERPKRNRAKAAPTEGLEHKELLTLDEVAALLGYSRRTVDSLTTVKRRGTSPRLRTVREPGSRLVRVTHADLEAYVTKLRVEAGIPARKQLQ